MKAIILAGGLSTRLRPLTNEIPKCLLELDGKAMIDYQLDNLRKAHVTDIVVVTGYQVEALSAHLSKHTDLSITYVHNPDFESTYPAYGLYLAREYFDGGFLYLNSDVVCHPDIVKSTVEHTAESVTAVQKNDWDEEEVNVILAEDSTQVIEMGKHISRVLSDGEFIGVTKISGNFIETLTTVLEDFVKKGELQKFAADSINLAIQRGGYMEMNDVTNLPAIEVDTPDDYELATKRVEEIKDIFRT